MAEKCSLSGTQQNGVRLQLCFFGDKNGLLFCRFLGWAAKNYVIEDTLVVIPNLKFSFAVQKDAGGGVVSGRQNTF